MSRNIKLPDFENLQVLKTKLKINGKSGSTTRALHLGEKVYMLIETTVEQVNHENSEGGAIRLHTSRIGKSIEVGAADAQIAFDKAEGVEQLFKADGEPNLDPDDPNALNTEPDDPKEPTNIKTATRRRRKAQPEK